jgi:hypothetical protein
MAPGFAVGLLRGDHTVLGGVHLPAQDLRQSARSDGHGRGSESARNRGAGWQSSVDRLIEIDFQLQLERLAEVSRQT